MAAWELITVVTDECQPASLYSSECSVFVCVYVCVRARVRVYLRVMPLKSSLITQDVFLLLHPSTPLIKW